MFLQKSFLKLLPDLVVRASNPGIWEAATELEQVWGLGNRANTPPSLPHIKTWLKNNQQKLQTKMS